MQLQACRPRWADIEEESDKSSDQEEPPRRKSVGSNGDQSTDHVMHEVVPLISENGVENRDYEYWLTWDGPYLWASIKTVFRRPKRSFSGIVASPVIVKGRGRKQSYILQIIDIVQGSYFERWNNHMGCLVQAGWFVSRVNNKTGQKMADLLARCHMVNICFTGCVAFYDGMWNVLPGVLLGAGAYQITLTIRRHHTKQLGLVARECAGSCCLMVYGIFNDSAIGSWNRLMEKECCHHRMILPGDVIWSVNGFTMNSIRMKTECANAFLLRLRIVTPRLRRDSKQWAL